MKLLFQDLRKDDSPIPEDVRFELSVEGFGPNTQDYLEKMLKVKMMRDDTDETHFE